MNNTQKVALLLVAMGMIGLGSHIEYAGWVLFFGLVGLLE